MANIYSSANSLCFSPSSSPQRDPDEISLFLQQILLRSSSSSSSFTPLQTLLDDRLTPSTRDCAAVTIPVQERISALEASSRLKPSSHCSFVREAANVSSSSIANLESELDEYDYESEDAVEAHVEQTAPKPTPARCSSKRSRAAEVHNLSEKRRRSRINEKMKALQNLIPNSNKTDKASMLDEAIEYLKQLQLQVQMLTMRNGLSLYPLCLPEIMRSPGQIYQTTINAPDRNKAVHAADVGKTITEDALLRVQEYRAKQELEADMSSVIGSQTPLKLQSLLQDNLGPYPVIMPSKGKRRPCQPPINDQHCTSSAGVSMASSIHFGTQPSDPQESNLEACIPSVAKSQCFHHS